VLRGHSEGRVGGGEQWDMVTAVRGWLPQQGGPAAQLPIPEHLGQELALGLRQKHDAEDAEEGTGRQYHMLQESSMAHVEALSWATQPSKSPQCHDQAQASAPDSGRDDFSSKEGAEDASSLGGEEAKDREGGDGSLVQISAGVPLLSPHCGEGRMLTIPQAQQDQGRNACEGHRE